jgi:hypothetical protein
VQRLSRKELYELVWSTPMKNLCVRFGISDVALKKTCARAAIPTPQPGYWAKKEAGKSTCQLALPERPLGMADDVVVAKGSSYWHEQWTKEELMAPLPPPPEFEEPLEVVRERIARAIGRVSVPREIRDYHPAVDRLLKEDERRREKQRVSSYPMSWDAPLFDAPFERRRLRILNTLFLAAAKMNGKPAVSDREARRVHLTFYQQQVGIRLDRMKQRHSRAYPARTPQDPNDSKLSFAILRGAWSETERIAWQDDDTGKLDTRITEIAVELILTAELQHREGAVRRHQWRVERKAQLEEEERQRQLEAARAERERRKRLEQARIDRLLKDAAAFQQASEIRKYVQAIRLVHAQGCDNSSEALEQWSRWAFAEADRIDPAIGGTFLKSMHDEDVKEPMKTASEI